MKDFSLRRLTGEFHSMVIGILIRSTIGTVELALSSLVSVGMGDRISM